jgi:uncharacterized membrane protein
MQIGYWASVTVHVLAALFWLGGMFFLGVVGAPVLRGVEPAALRQRLFAALGARFRIAGWGAIVTLVTTGLLNLHFRGWLGLLTQADFWRSTAGRTLEVKLCAVVVMVVASAVHDFWLGPLASRAEPDSPDARRLRRYASLLARVNALIGVVLVIAAVRLARAF